MPWPPANPPLAFSHLAGREVSTWSEEWKHECEIAYLAGMPIAKRNELLDGVTGGERDQRGIKGARGPEQVAVLRAEIARYEAARTSGH
jgi:hypothetical protein